MLGRSQRPLLALALGLLIGGCGSTVQQGSELTVYASLPLRGAQGQVGRELAAGMRGALERAGGEAGGAPVRLEVLDDTAVSPVPGGLGWTQAQVADNARTATEDSTAIAYLGELESEATRVSVAITNEAGVLQVSPGPVERELLAEPGGNDVPEEFQAGGERTLGALIAEGQRLRAAEARVTGEAAMAAVLEAIDGAEDPLSRASVRAAFFASGEHLSPLGDYTIDPIGRASYSGAGSG